MPELQRGQLATVPWRLNGIKHTDLPVVWLGMLHHHAQPTWRFHFLALGASRTVLGLHIHSQNAGEIALGVQSEAWPLSSGRAACEGFPQHKPLPCTSCPISSYPRQLPVTDHPPGPQEDTGAAHLEPTTAPAPHQTQVQHRNPQLASGSVWHHCALSKWVLCLVSPASWRQRGGFGGLYGRARNGADRTTLSWGRVSHTTIPTCSFCSYPKLYSYHHLN